MFKENFDNEIIHEYYEIFKQNLEELIESGRSALRPVPKITVSEWADKYRIVSSEVSAYPGKWNNKRVPFAVEIMDSVNDPQVEGIYIWGSAQVVKTEIINNIIGYFIHIDPSPMMVLHPTIDMARAYSREKLRYMIRDTPVLKDRVSKERSRDSENATLHKSFVGGSIDLAGGNTPNALAQRSKRVLVVDDADRIPQSVGDEGDPVLLAEKRTQTFPNRKIIIASTCTVKGKSRIESRYSDSDMRKPYVPCTKCGHYQILNFKNS